MDIRKGMPDGWRVFFRERALRPAQEQAIPLLLQGRSLLLSSPTASGKTEAAAAPLFQRHVSFRRDALSVVYVAPTRALVNDIYERLRGYFSATDPEVIQRYTGDHHDFQDRAGRFLLVATPEALDSLQLTRPERLAAVRAVVCDELHVIDGTARGQQLRAVVHRIRAEARAPRDARDAFQIAAMTATVANQRAVADRWCSPDAAVVAVGGTRPIDLSVVSTDGRTAKALAAFLKGANVAKALVFSNTRNGAQSLAAALSDELQDDSWPVHLHIGILGATERERIETAMKKDRRGICVATATLEVGIDIGDVDVVVLAEPPHSVASFLQRIGRGNRRTDRCVVWVCAADDVEEAAYRALHHCATRGWLDDTHDYERPSVDFQQALSLIWDGMRRGGPTTVAALSQRAGRPWPEALVADMLATGALKRAGAELVPSDALCDLADDRKIHSVIVGAGGTPLVDLHTGDVIGLAPARKDANGAIYAGSRKRVIRGVDNDGVYLGSATKNGAAQLAKLPSARTRRRGLSRQVVWAIAESAGVDPIRWQRHGDRLDTFGGAEYNELLAAVITDFGREGTCRHDAFGLSGLSVDVVVEPARIAERAREMMRMRPTPDAFARRFREATGFLRYLSNEMQREEARLSVPWPGFLDWLSTCDAVDSAAVSNRRLPDRTDQVD